MHLTTILKATFLYIKTALNSASKVSEVFFFFFYVATLPLSKLFNCSLPKTFHTLPHYCHQFAKLPVNVLPHIHDHRDTELVNDHKPALFCQGRAVIKTEKNLEIKNWLNFIHKLVLNWP